MKKKMRVMTEKPLNAETPIESLRTWTTDNAVFFKRNQGQMMQRPIKLSSWKLSIEGLVKHRLTLTFENIRRMPKVEVANTLECSGNSRSLLAEKASGNPWTIGGVGNAIWGGTWLKDLLAEAELRKNARHVSFEGMDKPLGSAGIKFIRSIPLEKAIDSTLLAYEMNGQPLPLKQVGRAPTVSSGFTKSRCLISRMKVFSWTGYTACFKKVKIQKPVKWLKTSSSNRLLWNPQTMKHSRRASCRFAEPPMPVKPVFRRLTYQLMTAKRGSRQA
jgi:hypothetical protein